MSNTKVYSLYLIESLMRGLVANMQNVRKNLKDLTFTSDLTLQLEFPNGVVKSMGPYTSIDDMWADIERVENTIEEAFQDLRMELI